MANSTFLQTKPTAYSPIDLQNVSTFYGIIFFTKAILLGYQPSYNTIKPEK